MKDAGQKSGNPRYPKRLRKLYDEQRTRAVTMGGIGALLIIMAVILRVLVPDAIMSVGLFVSTLFLGLMLLFGGWFSNPQHGRP